MFDLNRRQLIILNELYQHDILTAANLALTAEASIRTVKNDIAILKEKLNQYGIEIKSSPNKGYSLHFNHGSKDFLSNNLSAIDIKKLNLYKRNNYERIFVIIRRLLLTNGYIKLDDIANKMFVSRSTLDGDMPEVKRILSNYHLQIVSKANFGISLQGNELNKRICIAEYFFHKKTSFAVNKELDVIDGYNDTIIPVIEEQLRSVCEKFSVVLSDFSIKNIAIHVLISVIRNKSNYQVISSKEYESKIKQECPNIYSASQSLCINLNRILNSKLKDGDIAYIAMHLESKQILQEDSVLSSDQLARVHKILKKIYTEIKNNFDIDISNDPILNKYLALHILQMVRRIKNKMVLRNPVVHENLQKYLFATKVTISATSIIEDYYDIKINLDEFGYLLLYFNVALRNLEKKKKITICLISGRGRAETIMYINELKENFPDDKYVLINYDSLDEALRQLQNIDILVSSYEIKISRTIPQVAIEKGNYISKLRNIIKKIDLYRLDIEKYFKPEFLNTELEGEDKESILQHIVTDLRRLGIVEQDITVNPPFIVHEIGNNIVHIQDLYKICRKPICYLAILKTPIIWDKDIIRVIFLIKTKKDGDHQLNILCDMFSAWASDKENVKRLVNKRNYEQFMKEIQKL